MITDVLMLMIADVLHIPECLSIGNILAYGFSSLGSRTNSLVPLCRKYTGLLINELNPKP